MNIQAGARQGNSSNIAVNENTIVSFYRRNFGSICVSSNVQI